MKMGESMDAAPGGRCPSPEEIELLLQWHTLQSGLRRLTERLLGDVEASSGTAPSTFQVLWFLLAAADQAAPMSQVSQMLGFSTAGTTKVIDRLADAGLVERRPSRIDRRVVFAALTPEGVKAATDVSLKFAEALRRRVVEPLGPERFGSLADAVGSLDEAGSGCPPDSAACPPSGDGSTSATGQDPVRGR
ncbi:MarR family winged helix-turn-helix transcriptional regulator [Streptomyces sp. NPDC007903]|uniref:MarR family winged helix-turn-helix transcriptional regulator n=1 Tax=Streptomyces sp. NPDC007903 TaxID=3364786 RepID=UPI0036DFEE17